MNLKALPLEERPRERLLRHGADSLSTIELIAILLGQGTQNRTVLQLAADLLSHFGSLQAVSDASVAEVTRVKGIGPAKAIQLKAAFALWQRIEEKGSGPLLRSPESVYEWIGAELASQKVEHLLLLLRNVRGHCFHREILSKGTLTELLVHPREIFHAAIRHQAHSLILAHNHPSGDPSPSQKDLEMTQILVSASRIVSIELIDHLIIGKNSYFSFSKEGILRSKY